MKQISEYEKIKGPKCDVWKNAPFEPRSLHTGELTEYLGMSGKKISVCPRCKVNMENMKSFITRKQDPNNAKHSSCQMRDYDEEQRKERERNNLIVGQKQKAMRKKISFEHQQDIHRLQCRVMLSASPSMTLRQIAKATGLNRHIVEKISDPKRWMELHPKSWLLAEGKHREYLKSS